MAGWLGSCVMFRRGPFSTSQSRAQKAQIQTLSKSRHSAQAEASLLSQAAINADRELAIAEATERLKMFAKSLAANVDAHQSEIQAVSNSLQECPDDLSNEALCIAVNRLIEANERMQRELQSSQDHIQDQANRLETAERHAQTDALTRVRNRRAFDVHLARRVALGPGKAGTLMLLDIDNFKRFNNTHGHRTGDEVLRVVAEVLSSRLDEYGIVARYGGEEFAVILDGYSVRESIPITEAAREAIGSREVLFENKRLRVTASIGLAELGADESSSDWVQHADDCLYLSKKNGRNCGHWSDAGECFPITSGQCDVESTPSASVSAPTQDKTPAKDSTPAEKAPAPATVLPTPFESPSTGKSPSQPKSPHAQDPVLANDPEENKLEENPRLAEPAAPNTETLPENLPKTLTKTSTETSEAASLANPFPYLPDRDTLAGSARELGEHLRKTRMPMGIMAIQISERLKGPSSRSLLQIVRAASRTIDQIGCDGPTTLLICMPNTNAASSLERADQIVRSAASLNLGPRAAGSANLIGIGVIQWDGSNEFKSVFDAAQDLAKAAAGDQTNPVHSATLAESM